MTNDFVDIRCVSTRIRNIPPHSVWSRTWSDPSPRYLRRTKGSMLGSMPTSLLPLSLLRLAAWAHECTVRQLHSSLDPHLLWQHSWNTLIVERRSLTRVTMMLRCVPCMLYMIISVKQLDRACTMCCNFEAGSFQSTFAWALRIC